MSQGTKLKRDLANSLADGADNISFCKELTCSGTPRQRRRDPGRAVFLRLYEDCVDELTGAVNRRVSQGESKQAIAKKAGIAPALLSRVLSGRSGTNLRTIAAVLNGTDHRFRIMAVACEDLADVQTVWAYHVVEEDDCIRYVSRDGVWQESFESTFHPMEVAVITATGEEAKLDA